MMIAPNVEVTVTEKTTSVKKEKVTTVGDQEVRVVESSPTVSETLPPVTEVNEGDQVKLVLLLLTPTLICFCDSLCLSVRTIKPKRLKPKLPNLAQG